MKTIKIIGSGSAHYTKVLDVETGEDIGLQYGISRIAFCIGDKIVHPKRRLILELTCPVILEIDPSAE